MPKIPEVNICKLPAAEFCASFKIFQNGSLRTPEFGEKLRQFIVSLLVINGHKYHSIWIHLRRFF